MMLMYVCFLWAIEWNDHFPFTLLTRDQWQDFLVGILSITLFAAMWTLENLLLKAWQNRRRSRAAVAWSENERELYSSERGLAGLKGLLKDLPVDDEAREDMERAVSMLEERSEQLRQENAELSRRVGEYEKRPMPRELELVKELTDRNRQLEDRVHQLVTVQVDRDERISRLRTQPKYLSEADWHYLETLVNQVYAGFTSRLSARFPKLTPTDVRLCLLLQLRFGNAQLALLLGISPSSVSQQKFRLKSKLMQADDTLFKNGETLETWIWEFGG